MKLGRPVYPNKQYEAWLAELRPFLIAGHSYSSAIFSAGLKKHRTTLYEKSRLDEDFSDKIHSFQENIGDTVNEAVARQVNTIHEKVLRGETLNRQEGRFLRWVACNHRSAAPFFVQRNDRYTKQKTETDISAVIEKLEEEVKSNRDNKLQELKGQQF